MLSIDAEALRPLIDAVVRQTLAAAEANGAKLGADGDRLGYSEAEAAVLLGVARHTLRDARLRGEITARRLGKGYVYGRAALVAWLAGRV